MSAPQRGPPSTGACSAPGCCSGSAWPPSSTRRSSTSCCTGTTSTTSPPPTVGLVSDGFFHAFSWIATIAGLFLLADVRRRARVRMPAWWGAALLGAGGFQLFDGTINHKLLRVHQIRYVPQLPTYDAVWLAVAVLLMALGWWLWHRTRQATGARPA